MKLDIQTKWLKKLIAAGHKRQELEDLVKWNNDDRFVDVDAERLTGEELEWLKDFVTGLKDKATGKNVEGSLALARKIAMFMNLKADPTGKPIGTLQQLEVALKTYIQPSPNKWIFRAESDEMPLPYYVESIKYEPAEDDSPAIVTMSLHSSTRSSAEKTSVRWNMDSLDAKKTVVELLTGEGCYLENPEMVADYELSMAVYQEISGLTGAQYYAIGTAFNYGNHYTYGMAAMERDGKPSRVVMDDLCEESDDNDHSTRKPGKQVVNGHFWTADATKRRSIGEDKEDAVVALPQHPYVKVYDLSNYRFVLIHVNFLTDYEYDATLIDKLVLDQDKKNLVGMLIEGSVEIMEDIVKGKTGGVNVIATGPPGTGKTLTAQVFSEEVKCPLYEVQCSQLGTDVGSLEAQLRKVLNRAQRWKAIMLIDEADVYIHKRGQDIEQNAVVGVFLRVIESYRGVMFMTSNRDTIIDDAIMSRATAWIKYELPDESKSRQIWAVLSDNYSIKLSAEQINELVAHFKVSGRSIKNLLRLARMTTRKNKKPADVDTFKYVSQFLDL